MKQEEPLKGKLIAIIQTDLWDEGGSLPRGFFKKDIRSAVEWLKDEIINKNYDGKTLIEIIDEAFEDVVKNTKEKGK